MSDLTLEQLRDLTIPQVVCGTCRHWAGHTEEWNFDESWACLRPWSDASDDVGLPSQGCTKAEDSCVGYSWK